MYNDQGGTPVDASTIEQVKQLEAYTLQLTNEVLRVTVRVEGEIDEIVIFKGFSSSLTRPTHFDPDQPIVSDQDQVLTIDRLRAPFDPEHPEYIQKGLTWAQLLAQFPQANGSLLSLDS